MSKKSQKTAPDKSVHVTQRDKIDFDLEIRDREDFTEKQKQFINLVLDKHTRIVFVNGVAGTSKTFLSVYCGLKMLNTKGISDIIYIRSLIESASKSMGFLPGDADSKLDPFLMPLYDKLDELIPGSQKKKLIADDRIIGVPINFLRGANWNAKFIINDEAQNLTFQELTTLITRLGKYSKLIIAGDFAQSDINGKSGFKTMFDIFNDVESQNNGIHCFEFTHEDIVRSGVLKFIIEKIENHQKKTNFKKSDIEVTAIHNSSEEWYPKRRVM